MVTWTDPKIWEDTNNVNAEAMNTYLSENSRYLLERPMDIVTLRDVGNLQTTSTSFVAVSATTVRLNVVLQREANLKFWVNSFVNATASASACYDILMDGTTYLSSDDTTPLTYGIARNYNSGASLLAPLPLEMVYEDVAEGAHYFDLMFYVTASTLTIYTDPLFQFGVKEI